ncbi:phosphotransferase family protein [Paenibacillus segetis]|nr:aminoglycoside phosphotransferase family protein [Paenibacillus segetis]
MLDRFNLGKLISSEKTEKGAMGQTMFVTSTEGKFVFKGNPLFPEQFAEEKYFVENINHRTGIAVPTPYLIDDIADIFDWAYCIMPCLGGSHMNSQQIKAKQTIDDKLQIAELIADSLAVLHNWKVTEYGELDTKDFTIHPFENSYRSWLYTRIRFWLEDAKKYSVITSEDVLWVEDLLGTSQACFDKLSSPTFVMGDFKADNFLLELENNTWKISGLFDFTNAYFGDPLADLIKMIIMYIDNDEEEVAKHLVSVYLNQTGQIEAYKERIRVHMLQQRILDWGCAKAMGMVSWDDEQSFSDWVEYYTGAAMNLLN